IENPMLTCPGRPVISDHTVCPHPTGATCHPHPHKTHGARACLMWLCFLSARCFLSTAWCSSVVLMAEPRYPSAFSPDPPLSSPRCCWWHLWNRIHPPLPPQPSAQSASRCSVSPISRWH